MAETGSSTPRPLSRYRSQRAAQEAPASSQDATRATPTLLQPVDELATTQSSRDNNNHNNYYSYSNNSNLLPLRSATTTANDEQATRAETAAPTEEEQLLPQQSDLIQRRQSKRASQSSPLLPMAQPNLARKPSAKRYRDSAGSVAPHTPLTQAGLRLSQAPRVDSDSMRWEEEEERRRRLTAKYKVRREDGGEESPVSPAFALAPGGFGLGLGVDVDVPAQPVQVVHAKRVSNKDLEVSLSPPRQQQQQQPRVSEPDPDPVQSPMVSNTAVVLDGPPASADIRATKSTSALPHFPDEEEERGEGDTDGGCFPFFKRKKTEPIPYTHEKPKMATTTTTTSKSNKSPLLRQKPSREKPTIKPGGGGVVPGIDAPISAVNASGERQITVVCGKTRAMFPVTPTTTPVDIIHSAMQKMPRENIDAKSAVLLEDFSTVGVQRPLRRYERVRDVMNGWDADDQNALILVDPGTGSSEAELSLAGAPHERPGDETWVLDFSQKVGKWERRIITLKSDGQLVQQKENHSQTTTNLCHLSDFDVYRPTQDKIKKKIKPPKRFCFAVKSQQKTSMFESTQDFVHFFCTNDRVVAEGFYAAVQEWRSWYLVHVLGEGRKPTQTTKRGSQERGGWGDDFGRKDNRGGSLEAQDLPPSSKGVFDGIRTEKAPMTTVRSREVVPSPTVAAAAGGGFRKSSNQLDPTISPERRTSTARKQQQQYPPGSMSNRKQLAEDEPLGNLGRKESLHKRAGSLDSALDYNEPLINLARKASANHRRRPSSDDEGRRSDSGDFAPAGLLGRAYSQRQKDTNVNLGRKDSVNKQQRPSAERNVSDPEASFAEGGLLGRSYSQRRREYVEREERWRGGGYDSAQDDRYSPKKTTADGGMMERHTSTRRRRNSGDDGGLKRTGSTTQKREMPKPLIDLTPQYREPPQHAKKGRGFQVDKIGEGGLIDNATSPPEDIFGVPSSVDWRAGRNPTVGNTQQNSSSVNNPVSRSATTTQRAAPTTSISTRPRTARGETTPAAFTGEGLLSGAQAQSGWGTTTKGRGVMDGSRAKGPMLDMSVESKFAQGSLAAKVEAEQGVPLPVIDRSREDD